jgi:hypothetical protein
MITKEILQGALALFGPNGENWVGRFPRSGEECTVTAIARASGRAEGAADSSWRAFSEINNIDTSLGIWNDNSTWPEVKAAFEKAIDAC